jgi:hypothetical protein
MSELIKVCKYVRLYVCMRTYGERHVSNHHDVLNKTGVLDAGGGGGAVNPNFISNKK